MLYLFFAKNQFTTLGETYGEYPSYLFFLSDTSIKKSKNIIDEIDTVLAEYYGFTEEESDFIINYDIKYRMGKELENREEE